ncbi:nuclease [Sphingomonas sp. SRS2]|nr:nuclease [Sphingomonas sp. SRS2]
MGVALFHRADPKSTSSDPRPPFASCSMKRARYCPAMTWLRSPSSICLLLMSSVACGTSAGAETGQVRYVTDGDTFRLESGERIRIANIDAPEIHARQAKCRLEIERGEAASERARTLLDGKVVTFERVGRSYNRTVARVRVDGRDLGTALIAMGVARPWLRHHPKPDWCS